MQPPVPDTPMVALVRRVEAETLRRAVAAAMDSGVKVMPFARRLGLTHGRLYQMRDEHRAHLVQGGPASKG